MSKSSQVEQTSVPHDMPLTDQAQAYLRNAIRSGRFTPGQEIDFAALGKELGMSRTPIRESIRELLTEGLLELLPGGTVCVAQLTVEEAESFYHVRDELEIAAARAAAIHISDLELEMLKANLVQFDGARNKPELLSQIDDQFHTILHDSCNNSYLTQTLKLLRMKIGLLKGKPFNSKERINSAYKEHVSIIKALESHDPDKAEKAVAKHYGNARKSRLSQF